MRSSVCAALALPLLAVSSCVGDPPAGSKCVDSAAEFDGTPIFSLSVCTDSFPLVKIELRNLQDRPVYARGRLDLEDGIVVEVEDASGAWVPAFSEAPLWEPEYVAEWEEVLLPVGGTFGRFVDLSCPSPDVGRRDLAMTECTPMQVGGRRARITYQGWLCNSSPCGVDNSLLPSTEISVITNVRRP